MLGGRRRIAAPSSRAIGLFIGQVEGHGVDIERLTNGGESAAGSKSPRTPG
jgi:hypothetical protein